MPSRNVLAQIVCERRHIWGSMAASTASKAASKEVSKSAAKNAAAAVAPAPAPATETLTTTPKVKAVPKPQPVSPALKHFLGGIGSTTRTNAVKLLWEYIREHQLQDPADKKNVICDEKLKTVLGKDRVKFTEMPGLISPHFPKREGKKS